MTWQWNTAFESNAMVEIYGYCDGIRVATIVRGPQDHKCKLILKEGVHESKNVPSAKRLAQRLIREQVKA